MSIFNWLIADSNNLRLWVSLGQGMVIAALNQALLFGWTI